MTTKELIEIAAKQAEIIQNNVSNYEKAHASVQLLEDSVTITIQVETDEAAINLMPLPEFKMQTAVDTIRQLYQSEMDDAEQAIKSGIKTIKQITLEENKRKPAFINEDFDKVVNEMIESKGIIIAKEEQKAEVAPVQQKRAFTKDILSDKDLKQYYFKDGMTVQAIAKTTGC